MLWVGLITYLTIFLGGWLALYYLVHQFNYHNFYRNGGIVLLLLFTYQQLLMGFFGILKIYIYDTSYAPLYSYFLPVQLFLGGLIVGTTVAYAVFYFFPNYTYFWFTGIAGVIVTNSVLSLLAIFITAPLHVVDGMFVDEFFIHPSYPGHWFTVTVLILILVLLVSSWVIYVHMEGGLLKLQMRTLFYVYLLEGLALSLGIALSYYFGERNYITFLVGDLGRFFAYLPIYWLHHAARKHS